MTTGKKVGEMIRELEGEEVKTKGKGTTRVEDMEEEKRAGE